MAKYFDLFNIGWIVVYTDASKRYFDSMSGVHAMNTFREVKTYRVDSNLNFFLTGHGHIQERTHNRISLSDVSGSEVILKYHFHPRIKTDPESTVKPAYLLDDPTPFIKLINPPRSVVLRFQ
jgi:hypothetical protein